MRDDVLPVSDLGKQAAYALFFDEQKTSYGDYQQAFARFERDLLASMVRTVSDAEITSAATQMRAVLDEGYDDETALGSALESIGIRTVDDASSMVRSDSVGEGVAKTIRCSKCGNPDFQMCDCGLPS